MEREFGIKDHGQKARSCAAAGDYMEGCRRLADLLASPAGKLLADMLDHFPLTRNDLERLGDVFAELGKPRRAAACAGGRARHEDSLARQMRGEWLAHRLAARVRRNQRGRAAGPGGTHLGRDLVFGGRGFDVFQLQFHLIEELTAVLGTAAIELPPHLLYGKLEMGDQRLGAGDIGRSARGLRLRVNARGALQIVRQAVNRRCHGCEWSTDRVIRDLGIGQMSQNATGSSRCFRPPCALRVPPVNALQHVGELRRRDDNDAIGRRGPDELAALQPLGVERHAQSVMPKHLHEVAPAPTEHKEIAGMRIALQRLLHLQVRPFMPRRISVWPVAIHTRTPEGMGIIAAAVPSSPPSPGQDRRPRKYADERRAQTPARSAVWPQATGLELAARFVQVWRSQQL